MKDLKATAQGETAAPIETCFERLADVERYPSWHPNGVKLAEPLERGPDGQPTKLKAKLAIPSLRRDFTLHMAVTLDRPRLVEMRRLPKQADDPELVVIRWLLDERGSDRTHLTVALEATLDLPGFLPVGGIGDGIARGFLDAAVASFAA